MSYPSERATRWAAAGVVAATAIHFWVRNLADPDLWGHLTWGRLMLRDRMLLRADTFSYTAQGQPFFDHEWLADVLTAATFDAAGAPGLIGLKLLLLGAMVFCVWDAARTLARDSDLGRAAHPLTSTWRARATFLVTACRFLPNASPRWAQD